jgi:tetratricopeptide (TPR) repeat protein
MATPGRPAAQAPPVHVVLGLLALSMAGCGPDPTPPATLLRDARVAMARDNWDEVERLAGLIPDDSPEWPAAQLLAGEAATKSGALADALDHYNALAQSPEHPHDAVQARFFAGEVYRNLGRLEEAEAAFREVLTAEPDDVATHQRLAFVLSTTGRRWEAAPHYFAVVRSGTATYEELALFADLDRPVENRDFLEECAQQAPDDVTVQLGLAAQMFWDGEPGAEQALRNVLAQAPEHVAGQALLGELLVDQDDAAFLEWHAQLPAGSEAHPDIWYVRGLWARRHDRLPVAARCFWEAVKLEPAHRRAMYQLGLALDAIGAEGSESFVERADLLIQLTQSLDQILRTEGRDEPPLREAARLMEQMGRIWEACGWALVAEQNFPEAPWIAPIYARWADKLVDDLPVTSDAQNLAARFDGSSLPKFHDLIESVHPVAGAAGRAGDRAVIRFSREPDGPDFTYFNSEDASTRGARMFEVNGGGVGVFDLDRDGWPDLYFTQGAEWPPGADACSPSARHVDSVFRNVAGSWFDATPHVFAAGEAEMAYGQGCAVGDFNNDGFPDVYVANVGRNRLFANNGDGTLSDVTEESGLTWEQWTSSCAIADLNFDGRPDLFDVNYVEGENVYEMICNGKACSPQVFSGSPDRVSLNNGEGTFRNQGDPLTSTGGKGLGILVADIYDDGYPCLFVANDQVANFFLRSAADPMTGIELTETAFLSGLAYNADGVPLACMGVAADDVTGNGRLDFFVTNFEDESNTLYRQDLPGMFVDATKSATLAAPSYAFVSWGTQFLDADLDGHSDLVVVSGHVDDYRDEGGEYLMRPQFFHNTGEGRFDELFADEIGEYFSELYLGRGLARLDWNRDGLTDFAVSNIGDRASLVSNASQGAGHFLNVRLHATRTARDAIGTDVEVITEDARWWKQLLAGDGFMASNERVLQFGLGSRQNVTRLEVEWPSGAVTTIPNPPVDVTLELVEGSRHGILWRGTQPESLSVP